MTLRNYSCKTRPSAGWWVLGEVPPTIKLALFRRVKSGVFSSDARASSLLIEVDRKIPTGKPLVSDDYTIACPGFRVIDDG
ncbi:hypothetical protein B296_00013987 [Ensete ventricosum]|uniref:Uncharacterized protein n=1 Tax=Ensete ventricosum TaxID=4639 RepID=A0A426Y495_ENSVE|nr:hypothetical protein B296_00013987 [Ensete ventricosum]